MKKMKFDIVALIVGGIFFFIYLTIVEDSFFKFPKVLFTIYFFICMICFAFILENFESEVDKRVPSIFLRLIYLGLYLLSPLYLLYCLRKTRHEKQENP